VLPPVEYTNAAEVAHLLREVYHQQMNQDARPGTATGLGDFGVPGFAGEPAPG